MDGRGWGFAVAEERHCWRLGRAGPEVAASLLAEERKRYGRVAHKALQGRTWRWAAQGAGACAALATCGESDSAGDCDDGAERPPPRIAVVGSGGRSDGIPEMVIVQACDWLSLVPALRAMQSCRDWAAALGSRVPLVLPPPQADALLQFCLLEVLAAFDDDRLPLPLSAVYSEMRAAARRCAASAAGRTRLEAAVFRMLGEGSRAQQEQLLKECRPQHISWGCDLRSSGFRTLERLAKHFGAEKLIDILHQCWRQRIHHSLNTRTCKEWVLRKVNRAHPLFVEHELCMRGVGGLAGPPL